MPLKRAAWRAGGEGALAGVAGGVVLGVWEVRLGSDLGQGMWWLAGSRVLTQAAFWGLVGVGFSLALALVMALLRPWLQRLRPTVAALMGGAALLAAGAVFLARAFIFPLTEFPGSPRLEMVMVAAFLACALGLTAARVKDLLRDPDEAVSRWRRRTLALARCGGGALVLVWAALLGWPHMGSWRASGRPSVLVVSLDTLRADRLGALAPEPSLTPALDLLAAEGLLFTEAHSAAPWTLPSHVSLFTSLLPFDHHVRWSYMKVPPQRAMLAERFANAGYRTAAFTGGGYVSQDFGFGQGFEIYEDHDEVIEGGPEPIAQAAGNWIRECRGAPFFVFLHTYAPHTPYDRGTRGDPGDAGRLGQTLTYDEVDAIHAGKLTLTEGERRHVIALYDGDVAHTDAVIGGLLTDLAESGALDNTILVVLSDHGEDLWDHSDERSPGHGHSLYQELVRVPLFVRAPGRVPAGKRLHTPVSLLDVAPTLLDLAGLHPDPAYSGRSLSTALQTATEPDPEPVLAESVEYGPDRFMRRLGDIKAVLIPDSSKVHNNVHLPVEPLEIFDLGLDPGERQNRADELQDAARGLVKAARERAAGKLFGADPDTPSGRQLSPELEQQLRSLGYIQ